MTSPDTIQLMNMITNKLNDFFGQISSRKYRFENTTEIRKQEQQRVQKLVRKAFRAYKKAKLADFDSDLTEKEKEKLITKAWERLSQDEKLKYGQNVKIVEKKPKKKKEDQAFRPQVDL